MRLTCDGITRVGGAEVVGASQGDKMCRTRLRLIPHAFKAIAKAASERSMLESSPGGIAGPYLSALEAASSASVEQVAKLYAMSVRRVVRGSHDDGSFAEGSGVETGTTKNISFVLSAV